MAKKPMRFSNVSMSRNHVISDELFERHQTPWFQWFVMGLKEEGLEENMWDGTRTSHFYNVTLNLETRTEREAFIRSELLRLLDEKETLGDWARLFGKSISCCTIGVTSPPGVPLCFPNMTAAFKPGSETIDSLCLMSSITE